MKKENKTERSQIILEATVFLYVLMLLSVFIMHACDNSLSLFSFKNLLKYLDAYGTLVAGLPVLVTVMVAKQQLDASRVQHQKSVRRSFKKELDAIYASRSYLNHINSIPDSAASNFDQKFLFETKNKIPNLDIELLKAHLPLDHYKKIESIQKSIASSLLISNQFELRKSKFDEAKADVRVLLDMLNNEENSLSQYWS